MIKIYFVTFVGLILGQMSPGPSVISVIGVALTQGSYISLFVSLGIACASFTWALSAVLLFGLFLNVQPLVFEFIKLFGGAYLIKLAAHYIRLAFSAIHLTDGAASNCLTPASAFKFGYILNISNPKAFFVWSGIVSFLYGEGLSVLEVAAFAPIGFFSAITVFSGFSLMFSKAYFRKIYMNYYSVIGLILGLIFLCMGSKLIIDVVQHFLVGSNDHR
jgi:threonine efflux protein